MLVQHPQFDEPMAGRFVRLVPLAGVAPLDDRTGHDLAVLDGRQDAGDARRERARQFALTRLVMVGRGRR